MLGIILVTRGMHSGKDVILSFPNSIFKQDLSYFDSVHYNNTISSSNNSKTLFILGWPVSVIAELLCPKKERWDTILDFSAESIRFIGYPASINNKAKYKPVRIFSSLSLTSNESEVCTKAKENIAAFNVVLAFEVDSPLLAHADKLKEVVIAISNIQTDQTLKFEETRCEYLSNEVMKLKSIRDTANNKEEEIQTMIKESSLAKELYSLYTDLSIKGESYLEINGWLKLNLIINPLLSQEDCCGYHSLLFFDNPKRLEPLLNEKNQNNMLGTLMKKCKFPIASFQDISEDEGVPLKVVTNAALHFVQWKKAKLIPQVNENSLFVNSSIFKYDQSLVSEWERIFKHKEFELLKILSMFSAPKSIKQAENVLFGKAKAIPIITWLLRKGVIESAHYYLFIVYKTPEELRSLNEGSAEFESLLKILEFCNGNAKVEEIVTRTGVSLEGIMKCVKHFSKYLRMIVH